MPTDTLLEKVFSNQNEPVHIIGFGSLMSPRSARVTFPNLIDHRIIRIPGYRRVFRHPAAIFLDNGIANVDENMRVSSLSIEKYQSLATSLSSTCSNSVSASASNQCDCEDLHTQTPGFLAVAFTITNETAIQFLKREEEFAFDLVEFIELDPEYCRRFSSQSSTFSSSSSHSKKLFINKGVACLAASDELYIQRWGRDLFHSKYVSRGLPTIWGWSKTSNIKPCHTYLRHCYLAAQALGPLLLDSFLNDTYLIDRVTTIKQYLDQNPEVLTTLPPESLRIRYGG